MSARQPRADALPSSLSDDARRLGKGAITLLALGAPFVAAAPAAADGGGPEQPGNSQAASQPSARASSDGSDAGAGEPATSEAAAPQPPTGVDTSNNGTAASTPSAGTSGHAEVRDGEHGEAETSGLAGAEASSGATARGDVQGRAHAQTDNRGTSSHGSGAARPHARGDSRERASVHGAGEAEGEDTLPVEGKVDGDGGAGGSEHVRARVNDRRVSGGTEAAHGERGFTDVRVTPQAGGRVSAMVKASPALEAAIRAEAREAARAEVRARVVRPEAATRFALRRGLEGRARGVQRRPVRADERVEALLRILETAWTSGGPARASALLELCFGRPASAVSSTAPREQALRESQERIEGLSGHSAIGNVEHGGIGETVGAAPGERRENREVVGGDTRGSEAPTPIVEAPSVPLTAPTMPDSGVMPGAEGASQAPREADHPQQPRGSTSRPGATPPTGSAPGPGVTTGASAPSGVTREAGAAGLHRQLPFTGAELPLTIFAGATAVAAGALLRRRLRGAAR